MTRRLTPILFAALLNVSPALANGRFPLAQQLLLDPSDDQRMWLRATYGLLTSKDGGKNWSWICEQAAGYTSGEDPAVAVTGDGTFLSGAIEGLFATTDHGCTWSSVPGLDTQIIVDLTTESDKSHVLALTNFVEPDGSYPLTGWRSEDSGHTFAALAPISTNRSGTTIDVAPSDASRIYVTAGPGAGSTRKDGGAARPKNHVLIASTDGGTTWTEYPIAGLSADERPFIAAVHPTNPDVLFVRTQSPQTSEGFVESRLLYSDTAGKSFREVFRASADMLGFALADAGSTVLLGYGDSRDPLGLRPVDTSAVGVYRAGTQDFAFERGIRGQVGCLLDAPAGLFVCGTTSLQHYELGLSLDTGATASPVFKFGKQIDLLSCDAKSTVATACTDLWPIVCQTIGACSLGPDAGPATPATGGDGGCCSSANGPARGPGAGTGTARLDVFSSSPEALVAGGIVAAALCRRRRPRPRP
jgi:hypothetical protein